MFSPSDQVNLGVTLGKPVIPLLMENCEWPPPGAMGPIFDEFIYIRFFARPGEASNDDRYWPVAKFEELLRQLSHTHAPNSELVQAGALNWCFTYLPQVESNVDVFANDDFYAIYEYT